MSPPLANTQIHMQIHDEYEKYICKKLEMDYGILSQSTAYHKIMTEEMKRALLRNRNRQAMRTKHKEDIICVHKERTELDAFLLEAKTRPLPSAFEKFEQIFIDAMPLAEHIDANDNCLYICKIYDQFNTEKVLIEKGFWTNTDICKDIFYMQLGDDPARYDESLLEKVFGKNFFRDKTPIRNGSGDPYVIYNRQRIDKMKDPWELIDEYVGVNRNDQR